MAIEILSTIRNLQLEVKILVSILLIMAALSVWGMTVRRVFNMRVSSFTELWLSGFAGVAIIALNIVVWK